MPESIDLHLQKDCPAEVRGFLLLADTAVDRCYDKAAAPVPPMSEEQLKSFIAKAKDDKSIQEKLKAAKTPEDIVSIAKENGHEFTANRVRQLSEKELESIAGGSVVTCTLNEFCTFGCGLPTGGI